MIDDLFEFAEARRLRDEGVASAAEHSPTFSVAAFAAIERVARRQPYVHVDDVMPECSLTPGHPNAWGAAWTRAIKAKLIRKSGQTLPCRTDRKKHAHQYPVYVSLIFDAGSLRQ